MRYVIIWSGLGFLVPVIFFGMTFAINIAIAMIFSESSFIKNNGWIFLFAPILASIAITFCARHLHNKDEGTAIIVEETGERVVLKQKHTFFFVPMLYCGYFLTVAMTFLFLYKAFTMGVN